MESTRVKRMTQAMRTQKTLGDHRIFHDGFYLQESHPALAEIIGGRMPAQVAAQLEETRPQGGPGVPEKLD